MAQKLQKKFRISLDMQKIALPRSRPALPVLLERRRPPLQWHCWPGNHNNVTHADLRNLLPQQARQIKGRHNLCSSCCSSSLTAGRWPWAANLLPTPKQALWPLLLVSQKLLLSHRLRLSCQTAQKTVQDEEGQRGTTRNKFTPLCVP